MMKTILVLIFLPCLAFSQNTRNTFLGSSAGHHTTTGGSNTFIGFAAGMQNIEGNSNTFIGSSTGKNSSKSDNTFIGYHTGFSHFDGYANTFIGSNAGHTETGSNRLYIHNSIATPSVNSPLIYGEFENGRLGINTKNLVGDYSLFVGGGGILCPTVVVALEGSSQWRDNVFESTYQLRPLSEVAQFIQMNKHLPDIPSAQ